MQLKLEELDKIFSGYNTYRQIETKSVFVNAKLIVSTCWLLLESFRLWVHGDDKVTSIVSTFSFLFAIEMSGDFVLRMLLTK